MIIIYANNPNKGDGIRREQEALENGFSRTKFYELANEAFNILDSVLNIQPIKNSHTD